MREIGKERPRCTMLESMRSQRQLIYLLSHHPSQYDDIIVSLTLAFWQIAKILVEVGGADIHAKNNEGKEPMNAETPECVVM